MAVYTQLSQDDIDHVLGRYDIGSLLDFQGVSAGIENTNYKIRLKNQHSYFLTIFENLNQSELNYFLPLLHHLKVQGCHLPDPIAQKSGDYLFEYNGKPGAIFECLHGHHVEDIQTLHCERIGEELARIHLAAHEFPNDHANPRGAEWIEQILAQDTLSFSEQEQRTAQSCMSFLQPIIDTWPALELPHGFIHGDLFNDNCLFNDEDEVIGVIDFYAGGDDYWVYDLAITQLAWCRDDFHGFDEEKRNALQRGYERIRPLTSNESEQLNYCLLMACLRFYLSRIQAKNIQQNAGMTVAKEPEEIGARLRHLLAHLQP